MLTFSFSPCCLCDSNVTGWESDAAMLPQAINLLLVLLLALLPASAHCKTHIQAVSTYPRHLLALPACPPGCQPSACLYDGTAGGLRCGKCINNLILLSSSGSCGEQWLGSIHPSKPPRPSMLRVAVSTWPRNRCRLV